MNRNEVLSASAQTMPTTMGAPLSTAATRALIHVALTEDEWDGLTVRMKACGKKRINKMNRYINSLLIDFYARNKDLVNAPIDSGSRVFKHFVLPTQVGDFYQIMSERYKITPATFVTRYVLIPAICGFNANVSIDGGTESDDELYEKGKMLILSYHQQGITGYRDMAKDLVLTYGEEKISQEFLSRFRWIYTKFQSHQYSAADITPVTPYFTATMTAPGISFSQATA